MGSNELSRRSRRVPCQLTGLATIDGPHWPTTGTWSCFRACRPDR